MSSADFVTKKLKVTGAGTSSFVGPVTSQTSLVLTVANKAVANGVASLDAGAKVPIAQLPSNLTIPGGTSGQVQFNNAGAFGGAAATEVDANGCLQLISGITPVTPPADRCTLLATSQGGRMTPSYALNSGVVQPLQSSLSSNNVGWWTANGNSTVVDSVGLTAPTKSGTIRTRTVDTTSLYNSIRRTGYESSSGTGRSVSVYHQPLQFWRGNVANAGGFFAVFRFGINDPDPIPNARMFVGMYASSVVIGNVQPTTLTNVFGVGCDAGESVFKIIYNDASGTASSISLGSNFPTDTDGVDPYEFSVYCPANSSTISYGMTNLRTRITSTGTVSTDLPVNDQLLTPHLWRNTGSTNGSVGFDLISLYVSTDI